MILAMMGMRIVVSSALSLVMMVSLAGCAFSDPRIDDTPKPWTSAQANSSFASQVEEVLAAHTKAYGIVSSYAVDHPSDSVTAILATLAAQDSVLRGPAPQWRTPGEAMSPRPSQGEPGEALSTLRDLCTSKANATTGKYALLWASLAASAEQMNRGLSGSYSPAVPADPTRTITIVKEEEALNAVIAVYHQAIFQIESSIGFVPPGDPLRDTLVNSVVDLKSQRDTLMAYGEDNGFESVESHGIYPLPAQHDKNATLALVAENQTSLVTATGAWVASSAHPDLATRALLLTATFGWPYGVGGAIWPGWPDPA